MANRCAPRWPQNRTKIGNSECAIARWGAVLTDLGHLGQKSGHLRTHNAAQAEYDRLAALVFPWPGAQIPGSFK
jgi:hypothetical protein